MEIYDGERASTYGLYEKIIVAILSIIMFFLPRNFHGVGYRDVDETLSKALVVTMKKKPVSRCGIHFNMITFMNNHIWQKFNWEK